MNWPRSVSHCTRLLLIRRDRSLNFSASVPSSSRASIRRLTSSRPAAICSTPLVMAAIGRSMKRAAIMAPIRLRITPATAGGNNLFDRAMGFGGDQAPSTGRCGLRRKACRQRSRPG